MDEQIICIDDQFAPDFLAFYAQYGVVHPKEGKIYTPREVVKHSTGNIGLLLEELRNPEVPIIHPVLGSVMREPTWKISRFAHLNGTPLTKEEVKKWDRVYNLTKNLNF